MTITLEEPPQITKLATKSVNQESSYLSLLKQQIEPGEAWADDAHFFMATLDATQQQAWSELIELCRTTKSTAPSTKWLKSARKMMAVIGTHHVEAKLLDWLPLLKHDRTDAMDQSNAIAPWTNECITPEKFTLNNISVLKSLMWLAQDFNTPAMRSCLRQVASMMYKKIPYVGMRSVKLANTAVMTLGNMGDDGMAQIIILRANTKFISASNQINRILEKIASAEGVTVQELEERSLPDYGLTEIGLHRVKIRDFTAKITLTQVGEAEVVWLKSDGTEQKTIPTAIKSMALTKETQALAKELKIISSAYSKRLEQSYLNLESYSLEQWLKKYINHPIMGVLGRRLIWRIEHDKQILDVIYQQDHFVDVQGQCIALPDTGQVRLWHPIHARTEVIEQWRQFIMQQQITQPFKQAHREVYSVTEAERASVDHSLRFAGHVLSQYQLHAIATHRTWEQKRGGDWDSGDNTAAYRKLPQHNLIIAFKNTPISLAGEGVYTYLTSQEVRFAAINAPYGQSLALDSVHPLIFSEIMRDIDLFVALASVGNEPEWRERMNTAQWHDYWDRYSFGDLSLLAKTRQATLKSLIPSLKIAKQLALEGNFLCVQGQLRRYKIHLGSANILMEPDDRYLCIVESTGSAKCYLPYEGDVRLSMILSKAMLLAADDKIKDSSILSQIQR